ncbi:protein mono-ADP-ribosyltransferase PARP3 [Coregonus clupeaformis]|uniref:protein mono-ADP-ribosyltransferase PARP3 n=1 Tax=Coregonus clupeaformis TaxID=59861 RepID=UPI001E1C7B39|nr:protein mono-ADP-ribosyltransferase PARP3 [Coregonus clupeaformis]
MAPKRRAASSTKANKAGGKKVKQEPDTPKDAFTSAKEALKAAGPEVKGKRKADEHCLLSEQHSGRVYEDYDCMLNQTNIGNNNNKFYVIQVLHIDASYYCWTRWGRVGETGQSNLSDPSDSPDKAIKDFEKKFKDKTKNSWKERDNFVSHPGKYTLIDVDGDQDAEVKVDSVDGMIVKGPRNILPCTLDKPTQELIQLIFSNDMFKEAMECMNLDIKKMPLGKLSKLQIAKGFEVLEEIEGAMNASRPKLEELSSKFFTTIPHNFGRTRPPVINTSGIVEQKKEMLLVLADIEIAQNMKAETKKAQEQMEVEKVPHPLDQNYLSLNCKLGLLQRDTQEFKVIEKYLKATACSHNQPKIIDIWEVDRETEAERFRENDGLENRRLLWHGTNVAVVAAILKGGLRIMPQSGGRVGRGIYFASENSKSAAYVRTSKNTGVMFLNEVVLGKENTITMDDSSLRKAPTGYDCVVARGQVEPDPSKDIFLTLDGKQVAVPQGEPIKQPQYKDSHFSNSEYLVYKENQCCIRYLLELRF